jgi:antitoxin component YwqK of YwqJK toxin-antitoxin module
MRTQLGMSYKIDNVYYWAIVPSAKPHAQLDTTTTIIDLNKVQGVWRAISYRTLQFKDSASIIGQTIYRTNKLVDENNEDDALLIFDNNELKLFVKEKSKPNFKKKVSTKYEIENGRYLLAYKLFKASGNVSMIGIDKDGQLIINSVAVLEEKIPGNYINYYANIEQIILEKIQ